MEVLLSEEKSPETKKEILETEFDVPMTQTLESEVRRMCNLSQGVMERAMEKGVAKGIGIGEERGENKATLNAIRNVMDSFKVSVDAAMDALHIPEADIEPCSKVKKKIESRLQCKATGFCLIYRA